ncbi:DUF397 domain-containing protein [Streptomonospora litoralis]|uniref:DUF397 domain-containing protein n=1 Tax=Streptomonospora litoralis TaxID=2498135 RepID=A0A4V0ZK96_9ACTN|nr:DUF397 domain-containing protein [Streptomonospora litoralis]QBI56212.1 hypothetical protein EKD16_22295 [Streptomonospora litoralis]
MTPFPVSLAPWRKSSYSNGNGGECLECSSAAWHVSTYSGTNANCVEYAHLPSSVAVRDSKHPQAGHLSFSGDEWSAFLTAVKATRL